MCSATRSRRSRREKLAVAPDDAIVVLPDDTYAHLVPAARSVIGGAREAAEAFVGHAIAAEPQVVAPGPARASRRRDPRRCAQSRRCALPRRAASERDDYTLVASILADKDVDAMLATLRRAGSRFVATTSSSARALPADDLAEIARRHFDHVEVVDDPVAALARAPRARGAGARDRLALPARRHRTGGAARGMARVRERLAVLAFAALIVAAIIGIAFALGYGIGKLLL